jgi:hypothetical protein
MLMQTKLTHVTALRLGALALIGALCADLVEYVVDPVNTSAAEKVYEAAVQEHGRMIAAAIALLASAVLIVPAGFLLSTALDGRGRVIGRIAGALALLGGIGHGALAAVYLMWAGMPGEAADRDEIIAALDRVNESSAVLVMAPLAIAFPLSLVAIVVAVVRARIAPRWILVPTLAAPVVAIVGPGSSAVSTSIAIVLLLVAAVVLAGRAFQLDRPGGEIGDSTPVPA